MSDHLRTVATFLDPVAAALARNFLDGEGIPAVLVDETTIATDWMLGGAIGGIKLQVSPWHVERAELLLAQVKMEREADDETPLPATAIASQEIAEDLRAEREDKAEINQDVDRLFRVTVFGLIFPPLHFYALYLFLAICGGEGQVSADRRWKIWVSIGLNLPIMGSIAVLFIYLSNNFL